MCQIKILDIVLWSFDDGNINVTELGDKQDL